MTQAREGVVPLVRLRKLVTFDRVLARLMAVSPDRWLLKGAVALSFRAGPGYRTTKDLDLGRSDDEDAASADFRAAESVDIGDHFTFAIERAKRPVEDAIEGAALRYHAAAQLAGRRFEDITIDVAFGDPVVGKPESVRGPGLLEFADIPAAVVPAMPLEQHAAEKLHAYTRTYASGTPSTRVKDLIDLVAMSTLFAFYATRLWTAIEATFASRRTRVVPPSLPPPPAGWQTPYRTMAIELDIDPDPAAGHRQVAAFLDPILRKDITGEAVWDPARGAWQ